MKPFYVLCAWGELWSLGQWHRAQLAAGSVYGTAASGHGKAGILLTNAGETGVSTEVTLAGLEPGQVVRTYLLDGAHDMTLTRTEIFRGDVVAPVWELPAKSVLFVTLEKE